MNGNDNGYSKWGNDDNDNQQSISVNTIRNRNIITAKSHRHSKTRKRNHIHHPPSHPHPNTSTSLTQHRTTHRITPQHSIHHLYFTANSTRINIQQHFGGSHNRTLLRFLPSTLSLPTIMSPHTDSHHKETRMDRKREASPASWTPLDKKEVFHPNTN